MELERKEKEAVRLGPACLGRDMEEEGDYIYSEILPRE